MELRRQTQAHQALNLLNQGLNYTEIAKQLGVSRPTLYQIIGDTHFQELAKRELREQETHLQTLLKTLEESPSPQDRRTAAVELGKMIGHTKDKLLPHLTANLNIDATLDLNQLNQELQRHNQTLAALPPTHRQLYWQTYNQLHPNNTQTQ